MNLHNPIAVNPLFGVLKNLNNKTILEKVAFGDTPL